MARADVTPARDSAARSDERKHATAGVDTTRRSDCALVSVVTPVYNGERYLRECIDSVSAQTYPNWNYVVVNNCSTDGSLRIAEEYAKRDERITVVNNREFVGSIENHNIALGHISGASTYCKIVSADDWLYPDCLEKLVAAAAKNPGVGIVGSYAIYEGGVRWTGLPHDVTVFSGRDVCRRYLLGMVDAFGTPSTILYRSDLVRSRRPFFPGSAPSADLAACLSALASTDFAFVHQILSFERIHEAATNTGLRALNSFLVDRIEFLCEFGPLYLSAQEQQARMEELLKEYYRFLAAAAVNFRGADFWRYHRTRLDSIGHPMRAARLTKAVCAKVLDLLLNPKNTAEKAMRRLSG